MFFSISPYRDERFGITHKISNGYFNCDPGWHEYQVNSQRVFFKGYVEGSTVEATINELIADPTPRHKGNFCLVIESPDSCTVSHDIERGFPLNYYFEDKVLTNLLIPEVETVYHYTVPDTEKSLKVTKLYADYYAKLDKDLYLRDQQFDNIKDVPEAPGQLSFDQCVDAIKDIMVKKVSGLNLDHPVKLFLSGGIDTATIAAVIISQKIPFEFINYEHFEYDDFTYHNISTIRHNHWAYAKTQHWLAPSVLAAGGCGDEFIMRGPDTAALWAAWHGIDILSMIQQSNEYYHGKYFLTQSPRTSFKTAFENRDEIRKKYPTIEDLNRQILNILINDHQQWHLGNTLNLTLFKDLNITKIMLQANPEVMINQILGAQVSFEIIRRLQPSLLDFVATFKNQKNLARVGQAIYRNAPTNFLDTVSQ